MEATVGRGGIVVVVVVAVVAVGGRGRRGRREEVRCNGPVLWKGG